MPDQPKDKSHLKAAQAKHLADLFGDEAAQAPKPSAQQASAQSGARARELEQAAQAKRASLDTAEAERLAELQRRNQQAKQAAQSQRPVAPPAQPQPAKPDRPAPQGSNLHELSGRNDLADAALQNMRQHAQKPAAARPNAPQRPTPTEPATPQPATPPAQPAKRQPPSPEELDRLLREMAQRASNRSGRPQPRPISSSSRPESPESAGPVEAPPPPPDAVERESANVEKQAEILQELKAREQAQQDQAKPIPQADQERAVEAPVQAEVHLQTERGALKSDQLHKDIAQLQQAMSVHDAGGQVSGVNAVQKRMPGHPLAEDAPDNQKESR